MTLKEIFDDRQGFLVPYIDDAPEVFRAFIPIIDNYILSNYYNIEVDIFKYGIYVPFFLKAHYFEFDRIYKAINATYNPIDNYSMTEETNTTRNSEETIKDITHTGERINERVENGTLTVESENSESVIDTDNLKLSDKVKTVTTPENYGSTNTESYNNYKITESITHDNPETVTTTLTRKGNIGVTTSQQMIQSTFELEKYNTFIQYIVFKFINELTTGVYIYD